MKTAPLVS